MSANDGQAAITRPVTVGCATATLAARLATLPTTSRAHGNDPPRAPERESASKVVDAATIIPRLPTAASALPPTPAGRAVPPAGAYAGRRPFQRSAPAAPHNSW